MFTILNIASISFFDRFIFKSLKFNKNDNSVIDFVVMFIFMLFCPVMSSLFLFFTSKSLIVK